MLQGLRISFTGSEKPLIHKNLLGDGKNIDLAGYS